MIWATMALAAARTLTPERAEQARRARLARLGALALDLLFFGALSFVVNSVFGVTQVAPGSIPVGGTGVFEYHTVTAVAWPWLALLALAYFTVPEALFGASPGKHLAGLCVVRVDGDLLGIGAVLVRNVLRLIDWLPFFYVLGGAFALFTPAGQRLGDVAAGTTVVRRADAAEPGATRTASPLATRVTAIVLVAAVLFTFAFDYFGRPALIIEGMYNTRSLLVGPAAGYTIGTPQWGLGRVTYPVTVRMSRVTFADCQGSVTFDWSWVGWQETGSSINCGG